MARKTTELRPVMVRLPETLRRRVERDAERNGRSMNTEIIHRLEQSFALEGDDLRDQVRSLRSRVDESNRQFAEAQLEIKKNFEGIDLARGEYQALHQKVESLRELIDRFQKGSITERDMNRALGEFSREHDRKNKV